MDHPEIAGPGTQAGGLRLPVACLAMLTLGVNGTAIMAALPTMRHDLGLSGGQLEWAINAYLVASAACIVAGGKLSDRHGARRIAIAGLALFALAAAVVAMAHGAGALLAGRALQGLAAAMAVPGTLACVSEGAAAERRASAIGAWAGFLMLGFSLGPLIGGMLTHSVDWRVIFWASGIIMLVASAGLLAAGGSRSAAADVGRFDWAGFVLLGVFMIGLVSALHALPRVEQAPWEFLAYLAVSAAALGTLLQVERHIADALIEIRLFAAAGFVRAVALGAMAMSCILSFLLFYNLYAQSVRGLSLSAVEAGVSLLPLSLGLLMFAFAAPRLVRRFGPRHALAAGNGLIALSAMAVAVAAPARLWTPLLIALFGLGAGLALPYATAPRLALAALPADRAGAGSGLINACSFLGGSIGVAAGAIAFAIAGLPAVMALIAATALIGAWLCKHLVDA
jgi:MFS family permease